MPCLPEKLPDQLAFRWSFNLPADTMGGIAATENVVLCGSRDGLDRSDVFFCIDAQTGGEKWRFQYPAMPPETAQTRDGRLDFGNSPRATPLVVDDKAVVLGAMGHVHCLDLESGDLLWSCNLLSDYEGRIPDWGYSSSPLVVDGKVFLQPGGPGCSVIAIGITNGDTVWETPGRGPSYASMVPMQLGDQTQIIGLDSQTAGGWDANTGQRLWEIKPEQGGEFQVPTPILNDRSLILVGENNGARIHHFNDKSVPEPYGHNEICNPDTHTPVIVGSYLVALHDSLLVLKADNLQLVQEIENKDLTNYGSLITDGRSRVLVFTDSGILMLYEFEGDRLLLRSKLTLTNLRNPKIYSHPAIVGDLFYCIIDGKVHCLDLYND